MLIFKIFEVEYELSVFQKLNMHGCSPPMEESSIDKNSLHLSIVNGSS